MNELISIIVPIYNVEKFLEKCINSILNQTYKNIEVILIDDGSTDNSGKICDYYKKIDSRILVIHKINEGVSIARNTGIKKAKGEWITFVDSDDWIDKDFCDILLNESKKTNSDIILCGYNRVIGDYYHKNNSSGKECIYNSEEYLIKTLNPQTGFGFCHMKLYSKKCIANNEFKEGLLVGEDALFNEQISKNIKKAVFLEKNLYYYRFNNNSVVKRYDENYAKKYLESMTINKNYLFDNYKDNKNIIQNYYNYVAYHVLLIAINFCYHPENNVKNRKLLLKEICSYEIFKEGIKNSNYKNISITRKITLFTIKHKMYIFTGLISFYRQYQNYRKEK